MLLVGTPLTSVQNGTLRVHLAYPFLSRNGSVVLIHEQIVFRDLVFVFTDRKDVSEPDGRF